ncbi:hypothetical protein B0T14DRAFT_441401 [Immersiella caudata]|uniref:Uncharacterized protein n=1 Tax=Immersiella caudata TaxID=314043 RepID=A0AA39WCY2_9PEZI|nr:hypothetical protein B0T14DRAFT_441401 [Immersiella caudata]
MSSTLKPRQFLLDSCRSKYSWASGAARGTTSARDRYQKDLEIAFSEINGLMAGMQYQDQKQSQSKEQHAYASEISEDDLLIEEPATDRYSAPPEPTGVMEERSFASQWAAIHTVRDETEFHHKKFREITAGHQDDPILSKLSEQYPNSKDIRVTGAKLAKDVLQGFRPKKLSHVFAFTSFSYACSKLLYKRGLLRQEDILADLMEWRDLILDKREKQAFDRLASELWPESKEHLHFIDVPEQPVVSSTITIPPPLTAAALDSSLGLSTPPFSFQPVNGESAEGSTMNSTYGSYDLGYTSMPSTLDVGPALSTPRQTNRQAAEEDSRTPQKAVALEETILFLVVFAFLQGIVGLLNVLSGRNFLGPQRHTLFRAEEGEQEAFYHSARETFFQPFYHGRDSGKPACMALLSVAEKFTKQGYLQTFPEIQHYLVTLATVALPPGEIFLKFVASVASNNVPSMIPSSPSHNTKKREREEETETSENAPSPAKRYVTVHPKFAVLYNSSLQY